MRFDGPTLARAILAVMAATGDDKTTATTYKTIALEEHLHGVRLVATNRRLLLTAYVPDLDSHYDSPPSPDIASERVHVVHDRKGRLRGLMGHVRQLETETNPEDYAPGDIEVRIDFAQEINHVRGGGVVQPTLEGMDPLVCTFAVPGRERLHTEIVTDSFPDWRVVPRHASKRTLGVLLPPEQLEKIAQVRKNARGPAELTMGAATALITFPGSDPQIQGIVILADPDDPDAYQHDQDPDREDQPATPPDPDDPDQISIDEAIAAEYAGHTVDTTTGEIRDAELVVCPEKGCDYFADATEDGDGALTDVRHHMASAHQIHDTDVAMRRALGLPDHPATAPDVMLRDAAELVVTAQLGSAASLQRTLRIGQARAARLMDELERQGIVGPADPESGKSRPVLLKGDQVDQARQAIDAMTGGDR